MAGTDRNKLNDVIAKARQGRESREQGYREQALKLYPHVCGRCGREFGRENLHELTVHHRDHDHDNNPADGSNWELLCLYCHDNEHQRYSEQVRYGSLAISDADQPAGFKAFADLRSLIDGGDKSE